MAEWGEFLDAAKQSGLFKGGSAIGERITIGNAETAKSSDHIGGYMRFDAEDRQEISICCNATPSSCTADQSNSAKCPGPE